MGFWKANPRIEAPFLGVTHWFSVPSWIKQSSDIMCLALKGLKQRMTINHVQKILESNVWSNFSHKFVMHLPYMSYQPCFLLQLRGFFMESLAFSRSKTLRMPFEIDMLAAAWV